MKRILNLLAGIRFSNTIFDHVHSVTDSFLEVLSKNECLKTLPIHWNMPSKPFLEQGESRFTPLISSIQERIKSGTDIPLPMGYAGAIHPYLTLAEMEKEVYWARKNPWQSGMEDLFGVRPLALMPYTIDLKRKESLGIYKKQGFSIIGVESGSLIDRAENRLDGIDMDDLRFLRFLKVPLSRLGDLKSLLKTHITPESFYVFLLIDIDHEYDRTQALTPSFWDPLVSSMNWLSTKHTIHFTTVHSHEFRKLTDSRPQKGHRLSFPLPHCPAVRQNMIDAGELRKLKFKTMDDYRKILTRLSFHEIGVMPESASESTIAPSRHDAFPDPERITTASMQGNADLIQGNLTVRFDEGKLQNFLVGGKPKLAGITSRSYLIFEGEKIPFANLSTFAFEGARVRGLRESQRIMAGNGEPAGHQVTDYFFTEDFPHLLVTSRVEFKTLNLVDEIGAFIPFEIPLFRFTKKEKVIVQAFNGEASASYIFDAFDRNALVSGTLFYISKDDHVMVVGFPGKESLEFGMIEFQVEKISGDYLFHLALMGSYSAANARLFQGYAATCSFFLGWSPLFPEEAPSMTINFPDEIPAQSIRRGV